MPRLSPGTALLGLFLLVGIVIVVERLVVTDREAIRSLVEEATTALREGDFDALADLVHPDYEGEGENAAGAVQRARTVWLRYRPGGLSTELGEISLDGDRAEAPAEAKGWVIGQRMAVSMELTFERMATGWRIRSARLVGWPRSE
ncbi:MAG: nuclear transport factor 2 family protein [Planctomycetota bacterium]